MPPRLDEIVGENSLFGQGLLPRAGFAAQRWQPPYRADTRQMGRRRRGDRAPSIVRRTQPAWSAS
jgi:hypothetical protein